MTIDVDNRSLATDMIGRELRAIRNRYGITGQELAKRLECGQARVSKIESGKLKPSVEYVRQFATALSLPQSESRQLEAATELFLLEFDRWQMSTSGAAADIQRRIGELERTAKTIRSVDWYVLSGLLQTRNYASHLYKSFRDMSPMDAQAAVEERIRRQDVLSHRTKRFTFLVAEHVLLTNFCPRDSVIEQVERIRQVSSMPNVSFRFLPLGHPINVVPLSGFDIFDDRFVFIETRDFQVRIWNEPDVRGYLADFEALERCALRTRPELDAALRSVIDRIGCTWL